MPHRRQSKEINKPTELGMTQIVRSRPVIRMTGVRVATWKYRQSAKYYSTSNIFTGNTYPCSYEERGYAAPCARTDSERQACPHLLLSTPKLPGSTLVKLPHCELHYAAFLVTSEHYKSVGKVSRACERPFIISGWTIQVESSHASSSSNFPCTEMCCPCLFSP